jgi:ATP-dependent protease HslVU (ClpYQ) peptidase subunit
MTIIAGLIGEDEIWMGGDGLMINSTGHVATRDNQKVHRVAPNLLLGYSGDVLVANLLLYKIDWKPLDDCQDPKKVVFDDIFPQVRDLYQQYSMERANDTSCMVLASSWGLMLFTTFGTAVVKNRLGDYICTGSGMEHAEGSLHSTPGRFFPQERVYMAIQAAVSGNAFCGGTIRTDTVALHPLQKASV